MEGDIERVGQDRITNLDPTMCGKWHRYAKNEQSIASVVHQHALHCYTSRDTLVHGGRIAPRPQKRGGNLAIYRISLHNLRYIGL